MTKCSQKCLKSFGQVGLVAVAFSGIAAVVGAGEIDWQHVLDRLNPISSAHAHHTVADAPVADAGSPRTVELGTVVRLDAGGSYSPDGGLLSYSWQLISKPSGSAAVLSSANDLRPSFTVDVPGDYVAELAVGNGAVTSLPARVTISTVGSLPVADAGFDLPGTVGSVVHLDGSGSWDDDGDVLDYTWSFRTRPTGSIADFTDANAPRPKFTLDVAGEYQIDLTVTDGAGLTSTDSITVSTINTAPYANAGVDQVVAVGATVRLDGTDSADVDGEALSFVWELVEAPAGSAAVLSGATTALPTFVADQPGYYVVQLIVKDPSGEDDGNNGHGNDPDHDDCSNPGRGKGNHGADGFSSSDCAVRAVDTVVIVAGSGGNIAPIADAGPDQHVAAGAVVALDGARSTDFEGDALTYQWAIVSAPEGSANLVGAGTLSDPASVRPSFIADVAGSYVLQLIVTDGFAESPADTVTISTENNAPVARAGEDQLITLNTVAGLNGSASFDPDGNPLSYRWALIHQPVTSTASLSNATSVTPSFTPTTSGLYIAQLIVKDGVLDSTPDTVVLSTDNTRPVADAGPDQSIHAGLVASLDGTASRDVNGSTLTYQWSLLSKPEGSAANISDPSGTTPTISTDRLGLYVLQLVASDGIYRSFGDTVVIEAANQVPVADAGADRDVARGSIVDLSGLASSDPDGDPLTYSWILAEKPVDSSAQLSSATAAQPSFEADKKGLYRIELMVNDGFASSAADSVTIAAVNNPPVALAGPDQNAETGQVVQLDGSASSDPDADPLTYAWSITNKPASSSAGLSDPALVNPTITPDVAGEYQVQLTVDDGDGGTASDSLTISVINANEQPVLNPIGNLSVPVGQTLSLSLQAADADGDAVTFTASPLPLPAGSTMTTAGEFRFAPSAGQVGDHALVFAVHDGKGGADQETVTITVTAGAGGGITGLQGRVLDAVAFAQGQTVPVVNAKLQIQGSAVSAFSDADGYFTLSNLPSGLQSLSIATISAQPGPNGTSYIGFSDQVSLQPSVLNVQSEAYLLSRIDLTAGVPINQTGTTTVNNTDLGVIVTIAKGAAKLNNVAYTGTVTLGSTLPTPETLPPYVSPCHVYALEPQGLLITPAAQVTVPNADQLPAGTVVDLWALDSAGGTYVKTGVGQVSTDASKIVTISGGLPAGTLFFMLPMAPVVTVGPLENDQYVMPASLMDGNLQQAFTLPGYQSMEVERALTFVYNSRAASTSPIIGQSVSIPANSALPLTLTAELMSSGATLAGPVYMTLGQAADPSDPGLSESNNETVYQATQAWPALMPSGARPYDFASTAHYTCSKVGAVASSHVLVNDQAESPFGAGWSLAELQRLHLGDDGIAMIAEGDGTTLAFRPALPTTVTGGLVEIRAPESLVPGAFEATGEIRVIAEQQNRPLGAALAISVPIDGRTPPVLFDAANDLAAATLAQGTYANSHLLHLDAAGAGNPTAVSGTVTFSTPILGIIVRDADLNASDSVVGLSDVAYGAAAGRGTELSATGDRITLSPDMKTISVTLLGDAGIDEIRVITLGYGESNVKTDFENGMDGWSLFGDGRNLQIVASGGNPGKYLQAQDITSGDVWYFQAAPQFLGDKSAFYGGLLSYDLKQSAVSSQFNSNDVLLIGAGKTLIFNTPYNPGIDWTHYSIVLKDGAGWRVQSTNLPATEADMRQVLSNLTTFRIRGEYRTGADTDGIDNLELVDLVGEYPTVTDFLAPDGDFTTLTRTADGGFIRRYKDGTVVTFNAAGLQTAITDRNGNTTQYAYDADGRLTTITDPMGLVSTLNYDGNGNLTNITDPAGRSVTFLVDGNGNLVRVTDPIGNETNYAYDTQGRMTSTTDARGFATSYSYGFASQFIGSDRPDGSSVALNIAKDLGLADFGLGTPGNPVPYTRNPDGTASYTDPKGHVLTVKLNEFGAPVEMTDALNRTALLTRDGNNLVTQVVAPSDGELPDGSKPGTVTKNLAYDLLGNVKSLTEAAGTPIARTTQFEYEPLYSRLTKTIDPGNFATLFEYDAQGNRIKTTDALGGISQFTHNSRGQVLTATDANSHITTYAYDVMGNLELMTDALGHQTRHAYDLLGHEIEMIEAVESPSPRHTVYGYDGIGRLLTTTAADGGVTRRSYDDASNLTEIEDPTGRKQTRAYDSLNRLTTLVDPVFGTETYTYDANYNLVSRTDPLGNLTTYSYDVMDRLLKSRDALNIERLLAYDRGDNLVKVTDGLGHETDFALDLLNRTIRRTNPLGQAWAFGYDSRDNVVSIVDAKGQNLIAGYDALSRRTQVTTADNQFTYAFDAVGNLLSASDTDSGLAFTYDALDRLAAASTKDAAQHPGAVQPAVTLDYAFDALSQRNRMSDSLGGITGYGFDPVGRLARLTTPANDNIDESHDLAGRLTGIAFPNGVGTQLSYDANGRLSGIGHVLGADPGAVDLQRFAYTLDAAANPVQIAESSAAGGARPARNFTYDVLQRLIAGGTASSPETYAYDAEGNRTLSHISATHEVDAANRLLSDESFCYTYDANGNLTSKTQKVVGACSGPVTTYSYDAQDQLIRIDFPDGGHAAYRYDALGRRIEKAVDSDITRYVYDGPDIALAFDGTNLIQARYSHGVSVDQPLAIIKGGASFFYHVDHLGSITRITDEAGTVINDYSYDAYGRIESATEAVSQPYAYTGRELDTESGLYYYRARYYDPQTGRFLSEDPIGFAAGDLNTYRYVWNSPQSWRDPSGLAAQAKSNGGGTTAGEYAALAAGAIALTPTLADIGCSVSSFFWQAALGLQGATDVRGSGCGAVGTMAGDDDDVLPIPANDNNPPDEEEEDAEEEDDTDECQEAYERLVLVKFTILRNEALTGKRDEFNRRRFNQLARHYNMRCGPLGYPTISI